MGLASSLQKVADKVISKFGGEVIIRYVSAGSYNASLVRQLTTPRLVASLKT